MTSGAANGSELTHVQARQEAQRRSVWLGEGCLIGSGMKLAWKLAFLLLEGVPVWENCTLTEATVGRSSFHVPEKHNSFTF